MTIHAGGVKGRLKELQVGVSGTPSQDYSSEYFYDATARLQRVTGPGLPSYGAIYAFHTDVSDIGERKRCQEPFSRPA